MRYIRVKLLAMQKLQIRESPSDYILVDAEKQRMLEAMDRIVGMSSENVTVVRRSIAFPLVVKLGAEVLTGTKEADKELVENPRRKMKNICLVRSNKSITSSDEKPQQRCI